MSAPLGITLINADNYLVHVTVLLSDSNREGSVLPAHRRLGIQPAFRYLQVWYYAD